MPTKIPVHYFLSDSFLGTGFQTEEFRGKKSSDTFTFWAPHSWFMYCPVCGVTWARGLSTHPNAKHMALKGNCREHQGGSIYLTASPSDLPGLPKELALYELNLYFENPSLYKRRTLIQQTGEI